ncbi:hypothetical protein HETIRDRAFT_109208 [Heterobasidion irregulare TC 32-1]|uniref:Uncharacterized protein n=1 Tax=Heterobasidion irregulare (strain TC 32-1) TaxID=747525 RepID=W4KGV7_HETIT|nr:uncharacterized protein HETIRDRAFT_109208 [Heterobasidion irregulare TC 32-1]ETW84949.1 hypothetical protein HETIRDRAFT_109208 [Heterobasidion irregulare TC 32-1]
MNGVAHLFPAHLSAASGPLPPFQLGRARGSRGRVVKRTRLGQVVATAAPRRRGVVILVVINLARGHHLDLIVDAPAWSTPPSYMPHEARPMTLSSSSALAIYAAAS